jgi:hypothetical protein
LLKQSLSISATQAGGLRSLIRHRFKNDRDLQSPSRIANGLDAGHEVLRLLHGSAQGEAKSVARLASLLESTLKLRESNEVYRSALRSIRAPTTGRAAKANDLRLSADKSLQTRRPESRPILERPLPLSEIKGGKRRVPKFMALQGIPFLRYSKPQPWSLGRLLTQKAAWQNKKWDQLNKLTGEITPFAETEDAWDALVALQGEQEGFKNDSSVPEDAVGDRSCDPEPWRSVSLVAEASIDQDIRSFHRRNLATGRQMVEILKQERALAAQEKAESKSRKYEQRILRKVDKFLAANAGGQRPNKTSGRGVKEDS